MTSERIYLRRLQAADREPFLAMCHASRALHHPWISPPMSPRAFDAYVARLQQEDHAGFLVCDKQTHAIAGVINLNNIVRGTFLSASLGYYCAAGFTGQGYMEEGLNRVCDYAFRTMGLHRLEANIQPDNSRSIRLVQRCGFRREGLSPAFLFIEGAWRDHERWCRIDNRTGMTP
ncbi:MAG: GNAT family N-acetyltransferase [Pseudomonadales bacterium]|nr:GNAT family N-acetyltransferase [Pseudomonadales bacterium]MCP5183816.1 GNAT family N-acetyltransferase [Pseudomonadales bacterium]